MNKLVYLKNIFAKDKFILNNKFEKIVNEVNLNKNANKIKLIKEIKNEYDKKLTELTNKYENKLSQINDEIKLENLKNYDLKYNWEFNESEIDNIFNDLIKENISHILSWNKNNIPILNLPEKSLLIEIKNNNVEIINSNKGDNLWNLYEERIIPFLEYLKQIDLNNINLKFILIYCDNIDIACLKSTPNYDIPILCSSISDNCRKIYNNIILIPNMFFYIKNKIPIDEVKISDTDFLLKKDSMIFCGNETNKKRLDFKIWSKKHESSNVICNLINFRKTKDHKDLYDEKFISIKDQLENKYLISIDGFGTAWNGLIWKLYSNSLVLKLNEDYYEYWYSLLKMNNVIFLCNDFDEMYNKIVSNDVNSNQIKEMLINKKKVAKLIMSDEFNTRYIREILLKLSVI
uniref:Glycosyl transferase CAP10 domain-containing protein n=1 Tax=viral metagenome TaxID=1070528 RepID=A0A6C0KRA6_9ZZZZ